MLQSEKTANNEKDGNTNLLKMTKGNELVFEIQPNTDCIEDREASPALSRSLSEAEEQILRYFGGYLLKKLKDNHQRNSELKKKYPGGCAVCESFATSINVTKLVVTGMPK